MWVASFTRVCSLAHVVGGSDVARFVKWLDSLPHAHKVVIAGNHDLSLDEDVYDKWLLRHKRSRQV